MARKGPGLGTMLLAGAAAYAYYKYTKMSEVEKQNMMSNWKERGRKFYDEKVPQNVKNMFGQQANSNAMDGTSI